MIIEFFGKISSGKSSIAKNLSKKENFKIIKINSKTEKYLLSILFILLNPIKSFYLIKKCFKGSFIKRKLALVQFNMAKYQKAKKEKDNCLLDEGFLQAIFSILDYNLEKKQIKEYLNNIPISKKIIILNIDEKNREKRLKQRKHNIPEKMFNEKYAEKWEKTMIKNYDKIKKEIKNQSTKVIEINNKNINSTIKTIKNKLK